ncbi:MAG: hypothetical protein EFT35_02755 [Methanophagales archaeon ANME-1-THS]|nr:MAG: hypothetical protein EFT35_02755 [Methanophagales archaeon ANME-1-THS]
MELDSRTWFKLYYICLAVIVIAGLAVHFMEAPEMHEGAEAPEAHGEAAHEAEEGFWWLHIPLFAAFFAFIGGLLLLALAKLGIFPLIKRGEDYYEKH